MHVACGATDNFLPHLGVMLHSLLVRTPRRPLHVWLMRSEVPPPREHERLRSVVETHGGVLSILLVPDALMRGLPNPRYFHPSIWHRVLLPELLPDIHKVLYLDADMVVTDDLGPLWDTDLGDHLYGAVTAPFYRLQPQGLPRKLGLPTTAHYISSGVLLMDLSKMRAEGSVDKLRRYAEQHPDNPCPEQDALIAVYHKHCLYLDPRWNVQPVFFDVATHRLPFAPDVAREAVENPAVVHFAALAKPWHFLSTHPLRHLYFDHLRQTPWPVQPLEGRTLANRFMRQLPTGLLYLGFYCLAALQRRLSDLRARLNVARRALSQ